MRRLAAILLAVLALASLSGCALHLNAGVGVAAEQLLREQTLSLVHAQRDFATTHQGQFAVHLFDLIASYPALAPLDTADGSSSGPLFAFEVSADRHAYHVKLANQDAGGAASFDVLIADNGTATATCQGPGPVCMAGHFALSPADYRPHPPPAKAPRSAGARRAAGSRR